MTTANTMPKMPAHDECRGEAAIAAWLDALPPFTPVIYYGVGVERIALGGTRLDGTPGEDYVSVFDPSRPRHEWGTFQTRLSRAAAAIRHSRVFHG